MDLMKKEKLDDVLVIVGGIIPDKDIAKLKALGVSEVFQPGGRTGPRIRPGACGPVVRAFPDGVPAPDRRYGRRHPAGTRLRATRS